MATKAATGTAREGRRLPDERLKELLFARDEPHSEIGIEGIMAVRPITPPTAAMKDWLAALERGVADGNRAATFKVLTDSIPDFRNETP